MKRPWVDKMASTRHSMPRPGWTARRFLSQLRMEVILQLDTRVIISKHTSSRKDHHLILTQGLHWAVLKPERSQSGYQGGAPMEINQWIKLSCQKLLEVYLKLTARHCISTTFHRTNLTQAVSDKNQNFDSHMISHMLLPAQKSEFQSIIIQNQLTLKKKKSKFYSQN